MSLRAKVLLGIYMAMGGYALTLYVTHSEQPTLSPSCDDAFGAFFREHSDCSKIDYTVEDDFVIRCTNGDWLAGDLVTNYDGVGVRAAKFIATREKAEATCDCEQYPACAYK